MSWRNGGNSNYVAAEGQYRPAKRSLLKSTSKTIVLGDSYCPGDSSTYGMADGIGYYYIDNDGAGVPYAWFPPMRHAGFANLLMADAHVGKRKSKQLNDWCLGANISGELRKAGVINF
jgi:prepilin-type processing-associated H-X9-DG protein